MTQVPNSLAFEEAPQLALSICPPNIAVAPPQKPPFDDAKLRMNHRQRLRDRFMRAGREALSDYEMLELVLFRAIPRRDVKPLAKRLLQQFGDFNHVISAPQSQLERVQGIGAAAIQEFKIVEAAAHRLAQATRGKW